MTGKRGIAKTREVEGKTQVYMQLKSGESIIFKLLLVPCKESLNGNIGRKWTIV
mgnify:CR=1 FL=1